VLDAIYAAFATGWTDPIGPEIQVTNLAQEAIAGSAGGIATTE